MTSLSQKSINNSLTRANSAEIAGFAMPSSKYEDITLQTSGSEYTAPANGYYVAVLYSVNSNGYMSIVNSSADTLQNVQSNNNGPNYLSAYVPFAKGQKMSFWYNTNVQMNSNCYFSLSHIPE